MLKWGSNQAIKKQMQPGKYLPRNQETAFQSNVVKIKESLTFKAVVSIKPQFGMRNNSTRISAKMFVEVSAVVDPLTHDCGFNWAWWLEHSELNKTFPSNNKKKLL